MCEEGDRGGSGRERGGGGGGCVVGRKDRAEAAGVIKQE